MDDISLSVLVDEVSMGLTTLFIGPDVERDETGVPVFQQLCRKLAEEHKGGVTYGENDGFLFFIDPRKKNLVKYTLKDYFEKNNFGVEIFSLVAAIPFRLIVSLSPDDSIHQVFTENSVDHNFISFDSVNSDVETPTREKPLIYSLFGLAKDTSYILSQEDYRNYIMSMAGDKGLPDKIKMALNDSTNYIFIGFDFDKWYVRLLLMILNFHTNKEQNVRHAIQSEKTESLYQQLTEKQFNITFIENNDLDFIKSLHSKMKEKGKLKELKPKIIVVSDNIIEKQRLLAEYEDILVLKDDPKIKLDAEKQIEQLKKEIEELQKQLKN